MFKGGKWGEVEGVGVKGGGTKTVIEVRLNVKRVDIILTLYPSRTLPPRLEAIFHHSKRLQVPAAEIRNWFRLWRFSAAGFLS